MGAPDVKRRWFDYLLCAAFGGFAASTFTVDVWAVTGRIHGDDALARALRGYTSSADPLFGKMPFYVWALMVVSLFVFGPMDLLVVYALARRRAWIRVPGLMFAASQMTAMTLYFLFEAYGELPPLSWPTVIAANAPYLIFPALLALRLRRDPLF
jgi:hypothetical protein